MSNRDAGFSMAEVLIAIALFTILVTAVVAPLTGLFRVQRDTNTTLDVNVRAQTAVEAIRNRWTPTTYGVDISADPAMAACAGATVGTLPSDMTYTCRNLNVQGDETGACSGGETPLPVARRARLQTRNAQNVVETDVFLDVVSPTTR